MKKVILLLTIIMSLFFIVINISTQKNKQTLLEEPTLHIEKTNVTSKISPTKTNTRKPSSNVFGKPTTSTIKPTLEKSEPAIIKEPIPTEIKLPETIIETPDEKELSNIIITIDPGHQEKGNSEHEKVAPNSIETKPKVSSGTKGVSTGKPEHELTLEIALKLETKLIEKGATVVMVRRTKDINISNAERATIANKNNSNVAIRIHADGSSDKNVKGFSLLVPGNKYIKDKNIISESNALAKLIEKELIEKTESKSRGIITRNDLTGFNWLTVPSVLIETGFMTNPSEDKLLSTSEYQDKIVDAIVQGLTDYYTEVI